MRYKIDFDKTLNEIVPWYISGRQIILFLSSCLKPLQQINHEFIEWANETRIEASMTSQVFKLEWFLNRKFSKYFVDPTMSFSIKDKMEIGAAIYYEDADIIGTEHFILNNETENDKSKTEVLRYEGEKSDETTYSFIVYAPAIDPKLINQQEYESMLKFYINKYKISGKTFIIKYVNND